MTVGVMIAKMSEGLGRTCGIFGLTLLFSLPLGLAVAFLRMSKVRLVKYIAQVYISILRGTPLMLQLLVVAYGPFYISHGIAALPGFAAFAEKYPYLAWLGTFGVSRNKLIPIIVAYSLNYAAYFAEIYRGGILSMPVGQYEAASVLGYTKSQTFLRIILPQVVKRILPAVTNEIITLVKDTSMAFTVAYQEMFSIGKSISNSQSSFMPFVIAGVFYYVFNAIVSAVMNGVEKKLDYYR